MYVSAEMARPTRNAKVDRWLILAFEFYPVTGGAGRNAESLARGLASNGVDVTVLTYEWVGDCLDHDQGCPFRVIRFKGRPPQKRYQWVVEATRVALWLLRYGKLYDHILLADWVSQVLVNCLAFVHRRRFACCVLGSEVNAFQDSPFLSVLSRGLYHRSWGCFCISSYTRGLLLRRHVDVSANRVHVLPVPIAFPDLSTVPCQREKVRRQLGIKGDQFVLVQVSRLVDRKGHMSVLQALSRMSVDERSKVRYIVTGSGPLAEPLKAAAVKLNLQCGVEFLGLVPEVSLPGLYDASDVFVMPSLEARGRVEGFGIVYLEAAMRRRPSIGTTHGAIPEVVLDGRTGFLAKPGDSADLLAKIRLCIAHPEMVEGMGRAAEARAREQFSCSGIAMSLLQLTASSAESR